MKPFERIPSPVQAIATSVNPDGSHFSLLPASQIYLDFLQRQSTSSWPINLPESSRRVSNHIEKVAIVGVSRSIFVPASASKKQPKLKLQTGWWQCRQNHHRRAPQSRKAQNHRPYPPRQHEHNSRRRRNQKDQLRRPSIPHRSASGPGCSNHHNGT